MKVLLEMKLSRTFLDVENAFGRVGLKSTYKHI